MRLIVYFLVLICSFACGNVDRSKQRVFLEGALITKLEYKSVGLIEPGVSMIDTVESTLFFFNQANLRWEFQASVVQIGTEEVTNCKTEQKLRRVDVLDRIKDGKPTYFMDKQGIFEIDAATLRITLNGDYLWKNYTDLNDSMQLRLFLNGDPYFYNSVEKLDCIDILNIGSFSKYIPNVGYLIYSDGYAVEELVEINDIPVDQYYEDICSKYLR